MLWWWQGGDGEGGGGGNEGGGLLVAQNSKFFFFFPHEISNFCFVFILRIQTREEKVIITKRKRCNSPLTMR